MTVTLELKAALHQVTLLCGDAADFENSLTTDASVVRAAAFLEFESIGGADREQVPDTGILEYQVVDVDAPILAAGDKLFPLSTADG